jgi:DNA-binding HxlR family transcriptional regulator
MKPNACSQHLLPITDTLDCIGGKWKILILSVLVTEGPLRFRELQRAIGGITPRMLSKELKDLEMNELIERRGLDSTPGAVEYRLSDYGQTLSGVMQMLRGWGLAHRQRLMVGVPNHRPDAASQSSSTNACPTG